MQFEDVERAQIYVGDPAGETLAGLAQQVHGCRTQQKESSGPMSTAAALIDEAAQRAEKLRHAVDFVENDKPVFVLA